MSNKTICVNPTAATLASLKKRVNVGNLDNAELSAALIRVKSQYAGISDDELLDKCLPQINDAIAQIREEKMKKMADESKPQMIGNAVVKISDDKKTYKNKTTIASDKKTLYVFSDSAQAREHLTGEQTGFDVEKLNEEKTINSLLHNGNDDNAARTDINGDPMPNSVGLMLSINTKTEKKDSTIKDLTSDEENEILSQLDKDIQGILNKLEDTQYENVMLPRVLKPHNMSKDFATRVLNLLRDKLGIDGQVIPKFNGSKFYNIEIAPPRQAKKQVKSSNKDSDRKNSNKKEEKSKSKEKEAAESLQAERPTELSAQQEDNEVDTLHKTFPNLATRKSRIDYIYTEFSENLSRLIEETIDSLVELSENDESALEDYYGDTDLTLGDILLGLTSGNYSEQRTFALSNLIGSDGRELIFTIINDMFETFEDIANADVDSIVSKYLLNPEDRIGREFLIEAADKNWGYLDAQGRPSKKLLNHANKRAIHLKEEFSKMIDQKVFAALLEETRYDLELNEGIVLNEVGLTAKSQIDEANSELDETNVNLGKMDFILKYKLINPKDTLSFKVKSLLNSLYKTTTDKYGNQQVQYDDLGAPIRINPSAVYYILLDKLSNFNTIEEFDAKLDALVQTYPWMSSLVSKVKLNESSEDTKNLFDWETRKEFYRAMNKTYVHFGFISANGNLVNCNYQNTNEVLLDVLYKTYEGGVMVGKHSIYDESGNPIDHNISKIRNLVTKPKNQKGSAADRAKKLHSEHPFAWASVILGDHRSSIEDLREAMNIVRGESDVTNISLEQLLQDVGIDTSNLDMNTLVPALDEDTKYTKDIEDGSILAVTEDGEKIPVLTRRQQNAVIRIISAIEGIVSPSNGWKAGHPLIHDFKNNYLNIGTSLSLISDGYTQASFRIGDTTRFSYTVPSFIDRLCNALSGDKETAISYIKENYGKYDFFKDPKTGKYYSGWLAMMTDSNNAVTSEIANVLRNKFEFIQILAFGGSGKRNMVQNVTKKALREGTIDAYFAANDANNLHFGLYRNPLFSDVDAMCFFQFRRFTAHNEYDDDGKLHSDFDYQSKIISLLVDTFKQDLFRAYDVRNSDNKEEIEFWNSGKKRGSFLNFFPEFNKPKVPITTTYHLNNDTELTVQFKGIDDLLDFMQKLPGESDSDRDDRINEVLSNIIEDQLATYAEEFINSIEDSYKLKLYNRTKKRAGGEVVEEGALKVENEDWEEVQDSDPDNTIEEEEDLESVQDELSERQIKLRGANELLREFYYNDFYAQSQIIQMLGGDLAYYKNFTDFIKRNKQVFAGGERIYPNTKEGEPIMEVGLYLEDLERASTTWSQLRDLINADPKMSDIEKGIIAGAFTSITTTDGQSLRTLPSFKTLYEAMGGKWTPAMEKAYNRITKEHRVTAADFLTLWQPIKPFMFSHETRVTNGRTEKVVTQHKNSEYLLSAMYTMLHTAVNNSPVLQGLNKFMVEHGIDAAHFHSVVKEGYNNGINLNYDPERFAEAQKDYVNKKGQKTKAIEVGDTMIEAPSYKGFMENLTKALKNGDITSKEYNEAIDYIGFQTAKDVEDFLKEQTYRADINRKGEASFSNLDKKMVHEFPISDYMIMQPTDDHLTDTVAVFGSQLRNIVPADLPDTFTLQVGNKILNRKQAIEYYNGLFVERLIRAFSNISKEFNSLKSIESMLQAKMKQQPSKYGPDIRKALTLDETGLRFKIPFNSPNLRNKIEDLIISEFGKRLQKQKIKGGNAVLVSNYGLDSLKDFHVHYKKDSQGRDTVDYIPVLLTHTMSNQLKDFLVDGVSDKGVDIKYLDFDKMEKALGKETADSMLKAVGYRIPTEDKYSMFPIKIIGFMPSIGGATIMMPADIIELSGTDFDIDKLFLMLKNVRREIYSKEIKVAYQRWLEDRQAEQAEQDAALTSILESATEEEATAALSAAANKEAISDKSTMAKMLKASRNGLTEEEVESYKRSSELFNQFMEEEGFNYKTAPKYNVGKAKSYEKDGQLDITKTIRNSSDKEIDNALIDFVFNTLTTHEGSSLMMRQGTFRDAKKSSRIERILHNRGALAAFINKYGFDNLYEKLRDFGINKDENEDKTVSELDDFYDKYANVRSPMDINYWVDNHRNLMDGNDLIGILAVSSSAHYKLQFLNLTLKDDKHIYINGHDLYRLDRVYSPVNPSKRIGELCAQLQAASPDNGKDPCLGDMNINPNTADLACMLVRMGIELPDVGTILNSEEVLNYQPEGEEISIDHLDPKWNLDTAELVKQKAYITLGLHDRVDLAFVAQYRKWMKNAKEVARDLAVMSPIIRSDSPNGALSSDFTTAIQQLLTIEKIQEQIQDGSYSIEGFESLVDFDINASDFDDKGELYDTLMSSLDTKGETSPLGRLKAIFSLGFTSAFPIIQTLLSDFSDNSLDRLRLLMNETGIDLTRKKYGTTIKQFLNEFNAFLLTESQVFGDDKGGKSLLEKRNYYIHDFPIKFKDMMNARDDKGSPMYPNIISLPSIKRISNRADKGLKMDNIGKISPETRKWYVEAFDALLNLSTDNKEEKEAARKLAADLLLYSFYDNGMTFRHNSFSNFFSSTYMQSIPGLIDALRRADNINRSSNYYDERFLFQFLLNHPTYIKPIKRNQVTIQDNGNTLKIKLNSEHELPSEVYSGAQGRNFVEFLKVQVQDKQGNHKTEIFRKMSDSESTLWYQRITPQNTGTPYYDINSSYDDINFELIKARGNSKVRLDRVKKMNNKQSKVNSYSGDITPEKNTIFVFGSNPEGRHGAGAAKTAKEKFGAEPGVGEGLTGNAYALPTKDLRVKENGGLRSISKEDIIDNISKLYKVAQENPSLQFKVAYRNKPNETTLNGYTGAEMIEMFKAAGAIPRNVIFSSEWVNSGLFEDSITASTEPLVTDNFTDNEFDPSSASNINDSPIDIPTTQDNDYTEDDIRKAARNLGSIIGEAISEEFLKKAADSHAAKEKNKTKSFEELSKKDNGLCKG